MESFNENKLLFMIRSIERKRGAKQNTDFTPVFGRHEKIIKEPSKQFEKIDHMSHHLTQF